MGRKRSAIFELTLLPVSIGEGNFKVTQLFWFWELDKILPDSGFSSKILFFISGINQKYLFFFEKCRFTFEWSWVEWYTFQQKREKKNRKSDFGGLGPAPVSLGDFYARKPQKWTFQMRIWSGKNPEHFFCLTAEKSSMEVADPSPADHHNILKFGSVDCSRTDPSRARVQILLFRFTIHVG